MKKYIFLFLFLPSFGFCQDALGGHISTAKSEHASGNLQEARFELEQALSELDILISKEILALLPTQIGEMTANETEDQYVGNALGFSGIFIERNYTSANGEQTLKISLINDSPLLASISGFLNNSLIARMSGKKVIKVEGYKAIIEQVEGAEPVSFDVQIPFSNSLLTLNFVGIDDQNDIIGYTKQIPVKSIVQLAQ